MWGAVIGDIAGSRFVESTARYAHLAEDSVRGFAVRGSAVRGSAVRGSAVRGSAVRVSDSIAADILDG